jgi:integrase
MTRRKQLTDLQVKALKIRPKRYFHVDPELRGHFIRIMPTGTKSFACTARTPTGTQIWHTLGNCQHISIEKARELAREAINRIKEGLPPKEAPAIQPDSFADVAANWIRRHVEEKKLLSQHEIKRSLDKYLLPVWGDRAFVDIKRRDIAALLDKITDDHGPYMANNILSVARSIASWYQTRDDDYTSPFVKGLQRDRKSRDRVLDESEIKIVWREAGKAGLYGAFVKVALLTGQRRGKIAEMKWSDIADDVWTIRQDSTREKGTGDRLKLPPLAIDVIRSQPKIADNEYVFASATRGNIPIGGFSRSHKLFSDQCGLKQEHRFHDYRRTARTQMGIAGVEPHIAERVVGHVIGSKVDRIYDRGTYDQRKATALAMLADRIAEIVGITPPKVIPIRRKKATR